jgi:DNA-binding NtrC family response regulator
VAEVEVDLPPLEAAATLALSLADVSANSLQGGQRNPVDDALAGPDGHRFARVAATETEPEGLRLKTVAELEAEHIRFALEFYGWNITRTAAGLDIDRRTLHRQLEKLGLRRPPVPDTGRAEPARY